MLLEQYISNLRALSKYASLNLVGLYSRKNKAFMKNIMRTKNSCDSISAWSQLKYCLESYSLCVLSLHYI